MIAPSESEDWNHLVLSPGDSRALTTPGVVRVSGNDLKIGWDIQNASGTTGAITKRINEPLKEFDAEFDLSDEADASGKSDFDAWDDLQSLLESLVPTGKKPRAIGVYHPDLARNRITAVTVGSIGALALDGKGGGKIKVHFLEYAPPKPNKPVASTKTEGDKKIDAANAKIDALSKEWKAL